MSNFSMALQKGKALELAKLSACSFKLFFKLFLVFYKPFFKDLKARSENQSKKKPAASRFDNL